MNIHIVCIGTELLIGHTLNTNLAFLGSSLEALGFVVAQETCVPDFPAVMRDTFQRELAAADVVITVGGLGPTSDDLTRGVAAEVLGAELEFHQHIHDRIADFLTCRGVTLRRDALLVQSMVPRGATVLPNENGTAPGLWCPAGDKLMILLPGPPRELQPMFTDHVLPRLVSRGAPRVSRRSLTVSGVPESIVEERVKKILRNCSTVEPAYCARPSTVDIRLTATPAETAFLDHMAALVVEEFKREIIPPEDGDVVGSIARLLTERHWTLAVAESCTGGLLGAELTARPGSSQWFSGGFITYSNALKTACLDVPAETLTTYGAVSEATALAMVDGLLAKSGADWGIAVTGIAGPGGGTPEKPVGRVYIAIAGPGYRRVFEQTYPGNRENVRLRARATAFSECRDMLLEASDHIPDV
ncbi:MAG: competence/damage-inducible protein A [Lentisphaeria bacterium]|nr:competence/damage-inducible protein A [Lentisphaeria bacterium]